MVARPPQDRSSPAGSTLGWTRQRTDWATVGSMTNRLHLGDLRFEAFVVALAVLEVSSVLVSRTPARWATVAVTAASALVLLGRRWRPLVSCILAFALLTVEVALVPKSTTAQFAGLLATFAIAGAVNVERDAVIAWVAGAGMIAYASWGDPLGGGLSDWLLSLAFGTALWGAGALVTRRGRHAATMGRRARDAENDREQRTRAAVLEERARIARELHDVVSHGLSVAIVQTVAARRALNDVSPDGAVRDLDRRLAAVESTSRDALAEMRRMLGLLSTAQDSGDPSADEIVLPAEPTPGLDQLPTLIDRASGADLDVRLDYVPAQVGELPPGLGLAVFRVVQEALTNVVKHAPGATVCVAIARQGPDVVVEITDAGGRQGPREQARGGRGLVGMAQRVGLYDGTLTAGPRPGGGFAVHATFASPPNSASADTGGRGVDLVRP